MVGTKDDNSEVGDMATGDAFLAVFLPGVGTLSARRGGAVTVDVETCQVRLREAYLCLTCESHLRLESSFTQGSHSIPHQLRNIALGLLPSYPITVENMLSLECSHFSHRKSKSKGPDGTLIYGFAPPTQAVSHMHFSI